MKGEPDRGPPDEMHFLRALLDHMEYNRQFPKYQYERRIDLFISFFLPRVLCSLGIIEGDLLIPEFPFDAERNNKHSRNIDYFVCNSKRAEGCFVELKTDHDSCDELQLAFYARAFDTTWPLLLERIGVAAKAKGSKYKVLQERLSACPQCTNMKFTYLAPSTFKGEFDEFLSKATLPKTSLVTASSWHFLSLAEFAEAKIERKYQDEWSVVRSYIACLDPKTSGQGVSAPPPPCLS